MSKLFLSDRGRVLATENEEIARWRWVRKRFDLPAEGAGADADLWAFLRPYSQCEAVLRVEWNGERIAHLSPLKAARGSWAWLRAPVPKELLRPGGNHAVFRADNSAMNGWMLGLEGGHASTASAISLDQGATWRTDCMGLHGAQRGEYLVRLRSHSDKLRPGPLPKVVYEEPSHPRVRELARLIPASVRRVRGSRKRLIALRSWVAGSWVYRIAANTTYAPWDPWTILAWARGGDAHGLADCTAMCVQFGAVFAAFAATLGYAARCCVVTKGINTPYGHFIVEVWDGDLGKWVLHDPNMDTHYELDAPLSLIEISDLVRQGRDLTDAARIGPNLPKEPAWLRESFWKYMATAASYRAAGVWTRNNYISDPASAAPCHGMLNYTETDVVWYDPDGDLCPMFPHQAKNKEWFARAPGM